MKFEATRPVGRVAFFVKKHLANLGGEDLCQNHSCRHPLDCHPKI